MKTATKSAIRSTDELWQWAALKRRSSMAPKQAGGRSFRALNLTRSSAQMAQGILARLYTILRESCSSRR